MRKFLLGVFVVLCTLYHTNSIAQSVPGRGIDAPAENQENCEGICLGCAEAKAEEFCYFIFEVCCIAEGGKRYGECGCRTQM